MGNTSNKKEYNNKKFTKESEITKKLFAEESELSVISSCLNKLDKGWFGHINRTVKKPEDIFHDAKNRAIYNTIQRLVEKEKNPTVPLVTDELNRNYSSLFEDGAHDYVVNAQLTPPIFSLDQFTTTLEELDNLRQLREQVKNIETVLNGIKDIDNETVKSPAEIAEELQDIVDKSEIVSETQTFAEITEHILSSEQVAWTQSTNIPDLDDVLGGKGFESGCLTIIAARPKVGKTIFMNSMVHTMLEGGAYPIVLNYETKDIEFVSKMIARHMTTHENFETSLETGYSDFSWGTIKKYLSKEEVAISKNNLEILKESIEWAKTQDWYVSFDKTMATNEIEALVQKERAQREENARIVLFVDYLGLQVQDSFREREEITQLTRFYKRIAGKYKIAVVVLSQMNRTTGDSDNLDVKSLRSSGSIEQDADTILMLGRPHHHDETEPKFKLRVNGETTRLAEGKTFDVFIDGATNSISEYPEELLEAQNEESYLGDTI